MNFLDLFAGIGGFALGAQWAGIRFDKHFYSEVDPYAISVYSHRFPDAIPLGDIRGITADSLPRGEWIIAGGFPCQDISVAGKGAGLDGARSGLWYEYARLIDELRPRFAIMENVGALAFRGLDRVLGSLAEIGYDAEWQDIRASDVGAPHRRERIWIVAYPYGERGRAEARDTGVYRRRISTDRPSSVPSGEGRQEDKPDKDARTNGKAMADADRGRLEGLGERGLFDGERAAFGDDVDGCRGEVADAQGSGREPWRAEFPGLEGEAVAVGGGASLCDPLRPGLSDGNPGQDRQGAHAQPTGTDSGSARSQWATEPSLGGMVDGLSAWMDRHCGWEHEPAIPRVATGVKNRVDRLKCLGNSIVPQIAELIFREIGGQLDGP